MLKFSYFSFLDSVYFLIAWLRSSNKNPIKPGVRYLNWISLLRIYLRLLSQLLLANIRNKTHKAATQIKEGGFSETSSRNRRISLKLLDSKCHIIQFSLVAESWLLKGKELLSRK